MSAPLILLLFVMYNVWRNESAIPQYLSLVPAHTKYFAASEAFGAFVSRANSHAPLLRRALSEVTSDSAWLDHLSGPCADQLLPERLEALGFNPEGAVAALFLTSEMLALVVPVRDHVKVQAYLQGFFPKTVELVLGERDGRRPFSPSQVTIDSLPDSPRVCHTPLDYRSRTGGQPSQ